MIYYATGSPGRDLKKDDIRAALKTALEFFSDRKSVLIIPPGYNPCSLRGRTDHRAAVAAT